MYKPKKRKLARARIALLTLIALIALIAVFHRTILSQAGSYLKLDCTALPEKADAIIVLGGELDGDRTRKAAELYNQGVAPRLILSDGTKMSWRTDAIDEMYALAVLEGVPKRDILQEKESRSTYENAVYTKEMMVEKGYDSAVVVTTDWHARRSQFIFDKVYRGTDIKLNYCGTPDSRSDFKEWWMDGEKQQTVLSEWAKTIVYWVKYVCGFSANAENAAIIYILLCLIGESE